MITLRRRRLNYLAIIQVEIRNVSHGSRLSLRRLLIYLINYFRNAFMNVSVSFAGSISNPDIRAKANTANLSHFIEPVSCGITSNFATPNSVPYLLASYSKLYGLSRPSGFESSGPLAPRPTLRGGRYQRL